MKSDAWLQIVGSGRLCILTVHLDSFFSMNLMPSSARFVSRRRWAWEWVDQQSEGLISRALNEKSIIPWWQYLASVLSAYCSDHSYLWSIFFCFFSLLELIEVKTMHPLNISTAIWNHVVNMNHMVDAYITGNVQFSRHTECVGGEWKMGWVVFTCRHW